MSGDTKLTGGSGLMHFPVPKAMPKEGYGKTPFSVLHAGGVPIIPSTDGSPFTIGYAPDSDLVLPSGLAATEGSTNCATIRWTSEGWIVVDGTLDPQGNIMPGPSGVFVNGRLVNGFSEISDNDVIQIPIVSGDATSRSSFVFVDPMQRAALTGHALELGDPWLRRSESDGTIVATGSFRGIIDKYKENQDRAFFHTGPDGVVAAVADGMGGHASGERSAEIGRHAFQDAMNLGFGLGDAIDAMNADMYASNEARHEHGGAVFAGVHLHNDGRIEAKTVGDCEVVVMSLPADFSGPMRLDYWSTRPTRTQAAVFDIPTLADGRVVLGCERTLRLDPDSNVVERALGLREGSTERYQETDWVDTDPGRIYFAIPMSDGLSEQYVNHDEMTSVVQEHIRSTGDVSPDGIRDALLRDALIRCSLARTSYRTGRPFAITSSVFRQAYREMTLEMDGVESDPSDDSPAWRYQSQTGPDGNQQHFYMIPSGGTAYVVRGALATDQGWVPDPHVVNPVNGRMRSENPALEDHPSIVGRFKQDNISLAVAAFVREP